MKLFSITQSEPYYVGTHHVLICISYFDIVPFGIVYRIKRTMPKARRSKAIVLQGARNPGTHHLACEQYDLLSIRLQMNRKGGDIYAVSVVGDLIRARYS